MAARTLLSRKNRRSLTFTERRSPGKLREMIFSLKSISGFGRGAGGIRFSTRHSAAASGAAEFDPRVKLVFFSALSLSE